MNQIGPTGATVDNVVTTNGEVRCNSTEHFLMSDKTLLNMIRRQGFVLWLHYIYDMIASLCWYPVASVWSDLPRPLFVDGFVFKQLLNITKKLLLFHFRVTMQHMYVVFTQYVCFDGLQA